MKKYPWFYKCYIGACEQLTLWVAVKIIFAATVSCGLANFFFVLNLTDALQLEQSDRFVQKRKLSREIMQTVEAHLSLGYGEERDLEVIFRDYDRDLSLKLENQYKLAYELVLITSKQASRKLIASGWKKISFLDKDFLGTISEQTNMQLLLDRFGNLVFVQKVMGPDKDFFLLLRISTDSIGRTMMIKNPSIIKFKDRPSEIKTPLVKKIAGPGLREFILPINQEWHLVYTEPEISLLAMYRENLSAHGLWLLITIILCSIASIVLYGALSSQIAKRFSHQICNQKNTIDSMACDLEKINDKYVYKEHLLIATQMQIKAEHAFLSNMKLWILADANRADFFLKLEKSNKKPVKLTLVNSKLNIQQSSAHDENHASDSDEEIDFSEVLGDLLKCFEVCQLEKNILLEINGGDTVIPPKNKCV